jgi:hypothetical protein
LARGLAAGNRNDNVNGPGEQRLEGGGLGVRFRWRDDRYLHEIGLADRGGWIPVLTSVEGTASDDWPASPPFQSLNMETRAGGRSLALLVGMAGKSHWSASVELDPTAGRLTFDVACRARSQPTGPLGSCYDTLLPVRQVNDRGPVFATPDARAPSLGLELCEELGSARLAGAGDQLRIVQMIEPTIDGAQTIRWGYTIFVRPAARGA